MHILDECYAALLTQMPSHLTQSPLTAHLAPACTIEFKPNHMSNRALLSLYADINWGKKFSYATHEPSDRV